MSNRILIVDGLNLIIRNFVTLPILNEEGEHAGVIFGCITSLRKSINDSNPDRVFFIWDGKGGSQKRKSIYKEYKAGRGLSRMTNFNFFDSPEAEYRSLTNQSARLHKYLNSLPITQIQIDGLEADDVIGYLATRKEKGDEIIILSTDKDFLQLINDEVFLYNPIRKILIDEKITREIFSEDMSPVNFVLGRCFDGDKSDNIEGIKGVGLKTAVKLFPELKESKRLYPHDLLELCKEKMKKSTLGSYKKIIENFDIVERNYKLMQLDNVSLEPHQTKILKEAMDSSWKLFRYYNLSKMFTEDKMWKHLRGIESFSYTFSRLHGKSMIYNRESGLI